MATKQLMEIKKEIQRANRTESGKFLPGVSGNPSGRPKSAIGARIACRMLSDEALEVIATLMRTSPDDKVRVMCATRIRDEAFGKPVAMTEMPADEVQVEQLTDETLLKLAESVLKKD